MTQDAQKKAAAVAAAEIAKDHAVIGVGTGSTAAFFIEALAKYKGQIETTVGSSKATEAALRAQGFVVEDLNTVGRVPIYVDGADECTRHKMLIKGGGGALTREKILAASADQFLCIVDSTKLSSVLGSHALPIEVIPMARSYVARELVKLGGDPVYREGFVTDNGNVILDVYQLSLLNPVDLEAQLNNIVGVVTNGLFAKRSADQVLMGTDAGVEIF